MTTSPFPGMDPWLERHWGDVHQRIVAYACDSLEEQLPQGLLARMQDRVFVESSDGDGRAVYPDVRVVEHAQNPTVETPPRGGVAVAEPLLVRLQNDPGVESYIEIIDCGAQGRIVTVIEVLSPANKLASEGQDLYRQKQCELASAAVSLVEIDLLRMGRRVTNAPPDVLPPAYRTAYQACVRRGHKSHFAEVYRIPLRQRLPVIPIPLRPADSDIILDIQSLVDQAYKKGRYGVSVDYKDDPYPPLTADDAAWADELLKGKGLR